MEFKSTILEVLEDRTDCADTALIAGAETLSYREMIRRAKEIGRHLVHSGIRKGDRVVLAMSRNVNAVCSMLGIFYAGGVFVASDPRWPEERMAYVVKDTEARLFLDDACFQKLMNENPEGAALPTVGREDIAAIYYTSGSTGVPKGTVIHHKVLQVLDPSIRDDAVFSSCSTFLCAANFAYVLVLTECITAFNVGKAILLSTEEELASPLLLAQSMNTHQVDFLTLTPSVLLRLMELPFFKEPLSRLKYVALTGEAVTPDSAGRIADAISGNVMIHYGSTEMLQCTVSHWKKGEEVCLGTRAEGVKVYLLDEEGKEAGPGEEGEIFIGGTSAECGYYLNRPDLTAEKYLQHPEFGRLFRSGDYGRRLKDGDITLIGRKDGMVKLHGQRIEVEDVESAMEAFPGVLRAAVCVQTVSEKEALCAFYTAEEKINERKLREHLAERVPIYMIPAFLKKLDSMPENSSGKLDRRRLPQIQIRQKEETEKPRVSVLTPLHNTELSLLEKAASSVRNQTYDPERIEWILGVHNMDGNYLEEVQKRFGAWKNVKIFSLTEPAGKLGAIRNALLDQADGDYLFWLDGDDELTPDAILRVTEAMQHTGEDMLQFPFQEAAEEGAWAISRKANIRGTKITVYEKYDPRISTCFSGGGIDVWTWGFKTAFLKKAGIRFDISEYSSLGDGSFVVDALSKADRVGVLPGEACYVYYVRKGSDLQSRASGEKAYETFLSAIHLLEQTAGAEQEKTLDLNDWRWAVISVMLSAFTNPGIGKEQKEELHAKLRPWVDRLRMIDPKLAFEGRPEMAVADLIRILFPEEAKMHIEPVYKKLRYSDFPYTDPDSFRDQARGWMTAQEYHLIPDENNPFRAEFRSEVFPEIAFADLSNVSSQEKKEERIRGYMKFEELRGFEKNEAPFRITQFRIDEEKSELLFTWNERCLSEVAVRWIYRKLISEE